MCVLCVSLPFKLNIDFLSICTIFKSTLTYDTNKDFFSCACAMTIKTIRMFSLSNPLSLSLSVFPSAANSDS